MIGGVVLLLCVSWPFLLGGGILVAGLGIPLALLVGAGVLVWWFVSGEGPSGDARDILRRAALGVGILIVCGLIAIGGAWAAAAGGETVVAIAVIAAGVAILLGAFAAGPVARAPAVALALSAGMVQAAGVDLDGGVGDRDYRPSSAADLQDEYQLGIGQLIVDLRQTDLPPGDVAMKVDLGVGEARVIVPEGVCVATKAHVGVGEARTFERHSEGIDVDVDDQPGARPTRTRLLVDADVGVGSLRVGHSPSTRSAGCSSITRRDRLRARRTRGLCVRVGPTSPRSSRDCASSPSASCSCWTRTARSISASRCWAPWRARRWGRSCSLPA